MADSSLQVVSSPPFYFDVLLTNILKDRLREHAEAFDGLLSLIPAKYYYGEDNSVCARVLTVLRTNIDQLLLGSMEEEEANKRASCCSTTSKTRP